MRVFLIDFVHRNAEFFVLFVKLGGDIFQILHVFVDFLHRGAVCFLVEIIPLVGIKQIKHLRIEKFLVLGVADEERIARKIAETRIYDVERRFFLRNHQNVFAFEHGIDDQAGDGLRFARSRWALNDHFVAFFHVYDGAFLRSVERVDIIDVLFAVVIALFFVVGRTEIVGIIIDILGIFQKFA